MPFGPVEAEAARLETARVVTVTCSPTHGVDHTVTFGARLRAAGHIVVLHLAARMVLSQDHLDELLGRLVEADIHDVLVVGGDQPVPLGTYGGGLDILTAMRAHPQAPASVGIRNTCLPGTV